MSGAITTDLVAMACFLPSSIHLSELQSSPVHSLWEPTRFTHCPLAVVRGRWANISYKYLVSGCAADVNRDIDAGYLCGRRGQRRSPVREPMATLACWLGGQRTGRGQSTRQRLC